jgi:2'-5' RNA ligase
VLLVTVAYPEITDQDFEWIQSIREEFDDVYFGVIEPHFTFVFPFETENEPEFIQEIEELVKNQKPINFELDHAVAVEDHTKQFWHGFLVPTKGTDEITKLHDLLYSQKLKPQLREDIPFIPHLGIASSPDQASINSLIKKLNTKKRVVAGTISKLTICRYADNTITNIKEIDLVE